jgi:hypothetical protein
MKALYKKRLLKLANHPRKGKLGHKVFAAVKYLFSPAPRTRKQEAKVIEDFVK